MSNYVRLFGSNNVESVAESWVEDEKHWLWVDRAGWMWVEVDGGGCTVQQQPNLNWEEARIYTYRYGFNLDWKSKVLYIWLIKGVIYIWYKGAIINVF